ncbi:LysM peptidoglycan-binding domain-containing protein [bacterium AH-315-J21]|nr:LysM peptidoglycan-binding domain-containing protein [bacterium AH-315-J21]
MTPEKNCSSSVFTKTRGLSAIASVLLAVFVFAGCQPSGANVDPEGKRAANDRREAGSASDTDTALVYTEYPDQEEAEGAVGVSRGDTSWVVVDLDEADVQPVEVFSKETADMDYSVAVDDEIWRQLDLAGEYSSMGVVANQEGSWDEAQYYFERSLKILGDLDIESEDMPDSTLSVEINRYNTLLENVVSSYNVTLLSLGKLPADISPSALRERLRDFGQPSTNPKELPTVGDEENRVVTYDMPIVFNDRVRSSIKYFQTDARDAFIRYYSRSTKFLPMIHEIFRSYGLPDDLCYLALVESGYNTKAYSWAKAAGLWQFISSTGKLYGLKRSWWYDERRDAVKSTHAAAKYLKWLYQRYGDWPLAMAAYNAGPGKVSRTMKRDRTSDYWKLRHLRRETKNYIPLYMAATIICKDPRKYGFDPSEIEFQEPLEYDVVVVGKTLALKDVAKAVGTTEKVIVDLNSELLRKHTPPKAKRYKLKIPKGTKAVFASAYDGLESPEEMSWVKHRIRRGETISTIASKYGVSQYAIREANNMSSRRSRIYAGKTLIVPVPLDGAPSKSGRKSGKRKAENGIYIVRGGDSVYDISRAFGISMTSLKNLNNIGRRGRIYVNQRLKIPGLSASAASLANKTTKKRSSTKQYATIDDASGESFKHRVRRGENLTVIGRKYGVTVAQLRRWNGLGASAMLHPKQTLVIKTSVKKAVKRATKAASGTYVVRSGDSLWKIAKRYGLTVSKLRSWNNLSMRARLHPGQKLVLSASGKKSGSGSVWHTVRRGENLGFIAKLYRTSVRKIARDNNISNPARIKPGMKLRVS